MEPTELKSPVPQNVAAASRRCVPVRPKSGGIRTEYWVAGLALSAVTALFSAAWIMDDCGPDSKAVALARSLTPFQLACLHADMTELRESVMNDGRGDPRRRSLTGQDIPVEFQYLMAKSIRPGDASPGISLKGCFDSVVFLRFHGVGESKPDGTPPQVVLQYGEDERKTELLWSGGKGESRSASGHP